MAKLKRRKTDARFNSVLEAASRTTKAWFKAGVMTIALFIAALLAVIYFWSSSQSDFLPQGAGDTSFPADLIIGSPGSRNGDYPISYEESGQSRTAGFSSPKSMENLFSGYKDYFKKSGWAITNEITKYADSRGLYARRIDAEASVAIIDKNKNREVLVSLVGR